MRLRLIAGFALVGALLAGWWLLPTTPETRAQSGAKQTLDVAKTLTPFFAKHCVACHGPEKKKAGLALHLYKDEASILKDRKKFESVMQVLRAGEMPPEGRPRPTLDEVDGVTKTIIDLFVKADIGKRDPGRVTMRRLNRAEYNNTIRDLVGVDFLPAEDFPADDVGYGFDNIGDVLTISPLLMERYLAAAEAIIERAIVVDLPKPPARYQASRYLEPSLPGSPEMKVRSIPSKGFLHTPFNLTLGGDFKLRVRGYGVPVGKDKVKIEIKMNKESLKVVELPSDPKNPAIIEIPLKLSKGEHRAYVHLLGEYADPKDVPNWKLPHGAFLEWIGIDGPMDTRPETQQKLMAHKPGLDQREATREILTRFAGRAYRRPATPDEVDRLMKLVDKTKAAGEKWEAGIQLAMQAILCSPKFLFRVELDDRPTGAAAAPIDDYQLAARLSYFLWSTMPDDELLALAEKKTLHQNLPAQVQRMLKDDKARALVDNFAAQWLHLRLLKNVAPDAKLFPDFDEALRSAMAKETELFFAAIVKDNRSILDFLDGDFTFLNERLARHYGITDTNGTRAGQKATKPGQPIPGDKFVRVKLPADERGGLLTQASILTITSNPTRTSPVKRGRWVLEQLLGTPPPPPPPNVPELVEGEKVALKGTLRQRMEQHRKDPNCAACHARMDPLGFAFENFNAIGKFRTKEGDLPIDASGTLPSGQSFTGPGELKTILKGKADLFSRCLTEKLLTYALGRGVEYGDRPMVDRILAALSRNDYRMHTLLTEIVQSEPFRMRPVQEK